MNQLTVAQIKQLLQPIRPIRVLKDPRGMSHVSQQDVTAHLVRVLGFGNFDTRLTSCECIYEAPRITNDDKGHPKPVTHATRWDVAYRASMRLTIKNPDGSYLTEYEDASVGEGQNLVRHEAHDLAMKSAISLAKKRCAINLGDQFGLSLYNKGQLTALVKGTLVHPEGWEEMEKAEDMQDGVEQQVSLGVDETEKQSEPTDEQMANLTKTLGAKVVDK